MLPERLRNKTLSGILKDIIFNEYDTTQPPCNHSPWPNIICALSNIVFTGALALYKTHHYDPLYRFYLTLAAIIASTVYHLSEVKSRLPGLPWLRKYASILIQFDRIFAITLMLDVGYAIWPILDTAVLLGGPNWNLLWPGV
jgi:hypothetical protein